MYAWSTFHTYSITVLRLRSSPSQNQNLNCTSTWNFLKRQLVIFLQIIRWYPIWANHLLIKYSILCVKNCFSTSQKQKKMVVNADFIGLQCRFNPNPQTVNKYHADCPLHVYSTRAFLLCDIMDQHTTQGKLSAQTKLRLSAPVCSGSLKTGVSLALDRWPVATWFGLRATYFWILLARTGHLSSKPIH